jgi:hypothetical protein
MESDEAHWRFLDVEVPQIVAKFLDGCQYDLTTSVRGWAAEFAEHRETELAFDTIADALSIEDVAEPGSEFEALADALRVRESLERLRTKLLARADQPSQPVDALGPEAAESLAQSWLSEGWDIDRGAPLIIGVRVVRQIRGASLREAKAIVDRSRAWADQN